MSRLPGTAILALALAAGPATAATTSATLDLAQAIRLARQGPAVTEAAAAVERAEALSAQAGSALRPHLEFDAGDRFLASDPGFVIPRGALGNPVALPLVAGERHVWTASVAVRQLIWDAGRTAALLESAGEARAAAAARRRAVVRALDLAVLQAYREAARSQELLQVADAAVREYGALLDQVSAMVREEQLPLADQLQARAALEAARLQRISVRARLDGALAALEELVGRPVERVAPLPPVREAEAQDEEGFLAAALERRSELAALQRKAAALEARARAARAERLPVLAGIAAAQRQEDDYLLHRNNASVAVALSVPVLDGGLAAARSAELQAEARAARAALERLRRRVTREIRQAWIRLGAARQSVAAATAARSAAEEALRLARLRYGEELITNRELLDAEADAVRARRSLAAARIDLEAARLALLNLAGGDLLNTLDPNTPEESNHE